MSNLPSTNSNLKPMFEGPVSARALAFARENKAALSALSAGITGGFAVLSYRGKVWRIKHRGEEVAIMRQSQPGMPPEPVPSIPVVIVDAAGHLTNTWYEAGYTEGSDAAPDCFSGNGVVPDASSPKKQNDVCATCKWAQYGSRISADGKGKGKACANSKRLAIVAAQAEVTMDAVESSYGGPLLLRIPAASLVELTNYASQLNREGLPFFGVATWLYFEGDEAYPKIKMSGCRPLSEAEFDVVMALRGDERTSRIINTIEGTVANEAPKAEEQKPTFSATPPGETQAVAAPAPQPTPTPAPAPVQQAAPAPAPVPEEDPDEKMLREAQERIAAKRAMAATPAPQPVLVSAPAPVQQTSGFQADPSALGSFGGQGMAQTTAQTVQAAPTPAPTPQAAPAPTPQPAPAGTPSAAPQVAGDFTSMLDALSGFTPGA